MLFESSSDDWILKGKRTMITRKGRDEKERGKNFNKFLRGVVCH